MARLADRHAHVHIVPRGATQQAGRRDTGAVMNLGGRPDATLVLQLTLMVVTLQNLLTDLAPVAGTTLTPV